MKIPETSEEVVIHAPEDGPKDSTGQSVLKPIARRETKISTPLIVGIVGAALVVPIVAYILSRGFPKAADGVVQPPMLVLALGAILLAPPLVLAGYSFLRNDELEAYSGRPLLTRVAICAAVYAFLWGLHWYMGRMLYGDSLETFEVLIALPVLFVPGTLAAMATLDLDGMSGAFHYGFYLLVTVGLRLLMGLTPL